MYSSSRFFSQYEAVNPPRKLVAEEEQHCGKVQNPPRKFVAKKELSCGKVQNPPRKFVAKEEQAAEKSCLRKPKILLSRKTGEKQEPKIWGSSFGITAE